ncbi:MAG: tyrosine-type recombinase/integrase [Bacteroidales bacterium]|nr:tyrosine-type recombinase/integrase [Bacteroidales bacterium]
MPITPTYSAAFEEFINYYYRYEVNKIDEQMIIQFLRYLVMERKVSTSYQNQSINAIKFYYEKVLGGQRKFYFIDRPKKEKTLPTVLNEDEVKRLFANVDNIKHKCILMLAYSSGLRLGEIVRLRLVDIDRERMQIKVEQSKGKKDRYTKLAVKFLVILDQYLAQYKPKEFVFEGAKGGEYSPSSIQNTIKAVSKRANIEKNVTMHTLRHTFGTHCLENGVDLRYIQSLMGHESSRTTEIYTHVTTKGFDNIKSPLDNLDI